MYIYLYIHLYIYLKKNCKQDFLQNVYHKTKGAQSRAVSCDMQLPASHSGKQPRLIYISQAQGQRYNPKQLIYILKMMVHSLFYHPVPNQQQMNDLIAMQKSPVRSVGRKATITKEELFQATLNLLASLKSIFPEFKGNRAVRRALHQ